MYHPIFYISSYHTFKHGMGMSIQSSFFSFSDIRDPIGISFNKSNPMSRLICFSGLITMGLGWTETVKLFTYWFVAAASQMLKGISFFSKLTGPC